jgi:hypothetical protein
MAASEELPVASNSADGVTIALIYDLMAHDHTDSASLSVVLARPSSLVVNHRRRSSPSSLLMSRAMASRTPHRPIGHAPAQARVVAITD